MSPKWSFTFRFSHQKSTCISILSMRAKFPVYRNIFNWVTQIKCVKSRGISQRARAGFQEDGAPRFQDNRCMMVLRLSASHTGLLYSPGDMSITHFC